MRSALFGHGLLLGLAIAPVIADFAEADVGSVAGGRSHRGIRRRLRRVRLCHAQRPLIVGTPAVLGTARPDRVGIVAIFVSIPNSNIIYAVAGLGIFGAFTIFDFNRLRRASVDDAAVIALDLFAERD